MDTPIFITFVHAEGLNFEANQSKASYLLHRQLAYEYRYQVKFYYMERFGWDREEQLSETFEVENNPTSVFCTQQLKEDSSEKTRVKTCYQMH